MLYSMLCCTAPCFAMRYFCVLCFCCFINCYVISFLMLHCVRFRCIVALCFVFVNHTMPCIGLLYCSVFCSWMLRCIVALPVYHSMLRPTALYSSMPWWAISYLGWFCCDMRGCASLPLRHALACCNALRYGMRYYFARMVYTILPYCLILFDTNGVPCYVDIMVYDAVLYHIALQGVVLFSFPPCYVILWHIIS